VAQRRRDSQEGIFTKLKCDNQLDYVPTPTWAGNQIYLLSMLLAHNLGCAGDRPSSLAHNARETIPCGTSYAWIPYGVGDELLHYLEALKAA